ncbi:[protein-PII] uridylyltransferase [Pseudodesulfovibrio cashew]|uniref:Bifunctional uridylyltransferase/uridylyl-removing enzyme n=1 Tax=Pseudodesulfovibrio cashew TaxID=2678688 RepID=A0A6I6JPV1_9BACT|nr:[protein-PII] uridylyltransferase [Pseudodesulfovibrio cashew]QGY39674.1 [protein-PII] uridylyltransferase [Pseudodesulfovibrio cashew]
MQPDAHLPESAKRLKQARSDLWARAKNGSVGGFAWEYSHLVDQYFEDRILEAGGQRFAFTLVAVGGYGRGRLCPGSDVDVLLLFKRRIPSGAAAFVKKLLFPLWDLNFDLGHGVRTVADCLALAKKDFQVLASLLDARPLAGDADVFQAFRAAFDAKVLRRKGKVFAESLREHNRTRAAQYGDATGRLEPELKNGLGGLRDGQQVLWLSRVLEAMGGKPLFLPEELARLREDQAFVNRARTALHLAAGRKNDTLFFDLQPPTARLLGFAPQDGSPESMGRAVEFFLSRLHQAMTRIKAMRQALYQEGFPRPLERVPVLSVRNLGAGPQGIYFKSQAAATPENVLDAFLESSRTGLPLTWGARRLIRRDPGRIAARLIDKRQTLSILVEIFLSPRAEAACDGLLETRLLPAIFPEFGDVEHLIQFNDYHVHPVGRHTMAVIARLAAFRDGEPAWAGEIFARISDPKRLILAGFFHDLGKGQPSHSKAGARMARDVLARYGRDGETIEDVAFLVQHHLLIPKAATRHDLSDERVVLDVAATIGTPERLEMLYLLSVADSTATGPRAWNNWTRSLLSELYFKVKHLLDHGPLSGPDAAKRLAGVREEVLSASRDKDPEFIKAAMDAMPPRAFLAFDAPVLARQIAQVERFWKALAEDRIRKPSRIAGKGVNLVEAEPGRAKGTYRLTITALDRTGLFSTLAGAIALHGMSILAADLFIWKDGTAVDVFTVSDPPENLYLEEVWARISRSISYALLGKLDLAARLEERRRSPLTRDRSKPRLRPLVTVNNDLSDFYTIIEVAATDRTGFLFDMARVLAEHHLSIHLAKITTIKGRAADIFHVRDEDGQKVLDEGRIEVIRTALLTASGGPES